VHHQSLCLHPQGDGHTIRPHANQLKT
jgi:hypothetical protein